MPVVAAPRAPEPCSPEHGDRQPVEAGFVVALILPLPHATEAA